MATTADQMVKAILGKILVRASEAEIQPDEAQDTVFAMNNYMTALAVSGINLGYTVVDDLSDPITVAPGASIEGSCRECHRKPVASLPSRIKDVAFDHGTHLPPSAGPGDCAACHNSEQFGVRTSADLARTGAGAGLVYDPQACMGCHRGSVPVPQFAATAGERSVPEFSHGAHLGQKLVGGAEVGCTTCHVPGAGAEIGTLPAASNCTLCHAHSMAPIEGHATLTGGGITAAEVAACSACHQDGFPVPGRATLIASSEVVDLVGDLAQHHPVDQECAKCHLPEAGLLISSVDKPTGNRVFVNRTTWTPKGGDKPLSAIHRNTRTDSYEPTRKHEGDIINCFYCHWTDRKSGGTGEPELARNRDNYGDVLKDFPGGPALAR